MAIKEELVRIVGAENVTDDAEKLKPYSKDNSLNAPSMPSYLVKPKNADEIHNIVLLANKNKLPVVPCSSGIHFNGDTIPVKGGIILDLSRLNKILAIDTRNRMARVEAGVTWAQLQPELAKHDMMAIAPLLPHPKKSALISHLERDPAIIPKFEYTDALVTVEVVLPDGEIFKTGSAAVPGFPEKSFSQGVNPSGPGNMMWTRMLQGAQGTLGVVTWGQFKIEYRPKIDKSYFIPFKSVKDATVAVSKIQRRMIGQECLILNNVDLAAVLAKQWPGDFNTLREKLPPWTLILVLGGGVRFPEEKIEYEEDALNAVAKELSIKVLPTSLPAAPGVEKGIADMLREAWPTDRTYWKLAYKGGCQDLFFHTVMGKAQAFYEAIGKVAVKYNYPAADLGYYVQPVVYGGACHFECNFYYDPANAADVKNVTKLYAEAAKTTLDMGAFYSRPYGPVTDLVYQRAASYTEQLKKVKKLMDPNNIMSPGRLCF
ncbi:MAG TPA: FAD-binding oxidoreductase [Dehalococcoidia bacterium]|nr:FAD-binding oxidoreductase [Dehalococcoidia bacterium]